MDAERRRGGDDKRGLRDHADAREIAVEVERKFRVPGGQNQERR
jgi:hypothetical protein